jgi:hypothetical protein
VDLGDHGGALANCCGNALGRAGSHIADRKYAWPTYLERQGLPPRRSHIIGEVSPGYHEAFVVD